MPPLSFEDAINAAEREITRLTEDYPKHLYAMLSEMEGAAKNAQWDRVLVMAHDIKGQAATLGQPVIGEIARSLQESLETPARDLFAESVRLHLASLRYANLGPATIWRPGASETGRMWSVNLEQANLSFADMSEANLKEANMSDADLTGADLTDADIEEINVSGSVIKDTVTDSGLAQSSGDVSKGSTSSKRRDD